MSKGKAIAALAAALIFTVIAVMPICVYAADSPAGSGQVQTAPAAETDAPAVVPEEMAQFQTDPILAAPDPILPGDTVLVSVILTKPLAPGQTLTAIGNEGVLSAMVSQDETVYTFDSAPMESETIAIVLSGGIGPDSVQSIEIPVEGSSPEPAPYAQETYDLAEIAVPVAGAQAEITPSLEGTGWFVVLPPAVAGMKYTAKELAASFVPADGRYIIITDEDGTSVADDTPAATGQIMQVIGEDGIEAAADVVVMGDVLGTGTLGLGQVVKMAQAIRSDSVLSGPYLAAGMLAQGSTIGTRDLVIEAGLLKAA